MGARGRDAASADSQATCKPSRVHERTAVVSLFAGHPQKRPQGTRGAICFVSTTPSGALRYSPPLAVVAILKFRSGRVTHCANHAVGTLDQNGISSCERIRQLVVAV